MSNKRSTTKPGSSGSKSRRQIKRRKRTSIWLWVGIGVAGIAALVVIALLLSGGTKVNEITAAEAYQKYQDGAFFLDVRTQSEWDQLHIPNSTLIPLDELENRLNELPRDRDIVVVCLSGQRSKEGMTVLKKAGFSRAACMNGGINIWKGARYPVESSLP